MFLRSLRKWWIIKVMSGNSFHSTYKLRHVSLCICVPPIWISKISVASHRWLNVLLSFVDLSFNIHIHILLNCYQFTRLPIWWSEYVFEIEFGDLILFEIQRINTHTHINGQFRCTKNDIKWKWKWFVYKNAKWQHYISFIRIAFVMLTWFNANTLC